MRFRIYNIWDHRPGAHIGEEYNFDIPIENDEEIKDQLDEYLFNCGCYFDSYEWEIVEDA